MTDRPPSVRQARFPGEYGERGGDADRPASWEEVEERLERSRAYWLSTVSPGGVPHARPVDGVWIDGALCFGGSPETVWVRNLLADPAISVHLPSGEDVVILEGRAELITDPDHPLAGPSRTASREKYPEYHSPDGDDAGGGAAADFQPFWMVRPSVAYAWTLAGFPNGATRWTFEG